MRGRRVLGAAALLAAVSAPTATAVAAPADLDPTFGTGGVATLGPADAYSTANGIAVASDQSIIVVGAVLGATGRDALVARLRPDGSVDPTFGERRLTTPVSGNEGGYAAAVQGDGRVVVAGSTDAGADAVVWRLLPDGELDKSFGGGDGMVVETAIGDESFDDVAVAPDGGIVAVGHSGGGAGSVATVYRYDTTGEPDTSFDQDGRLSFGTSTRRNVASGVAVQPDGRILVTGDIDAGAGLTVRRLTVAGAPDPSFGGGDGVATAPTAPTAGPDVSLGPDGRITVAGTLHVGQNNDAGAVRFTASGDLDPSFGSPTGALIDLGGFEYVDAVATMPDGGVVASGHRDVGDDAVVYKWRPDGTPDPSFGTGGGLTLAGAPETAYGIAVQADAKVLVASHDAGSPSRAGVRRFLADHSDPGPTAAPTCRGRAATIVGTAGKDRLRGTRKADVIVALGGADRIKGVGGDDVVCAGDGDDRVVGGPGKDRLYGERGRDRLTGGSGKDRLVGGPDRDTTHP